MSIQVDHKRGDSFVMTASITGDGGLPDTALPTAFSSQIRTSLGKLMSDCAVTAGSTAGEYVFTVADTSAWPLGALMWDIKRTVSGISRRSGTVTIDVQLGVTQ